MFVFEVKLKRPKKSINTGKMKIKYDQEVDILLIQLLESKVYESDESKPGVILDYDKEGNIIKKKYSHIQKPGNLFK